MRIQQIISICSVLLISLFLSSCSVIGGIFKAGMGFGIFIVLLIIAIIVFIIMRGSRK